MKRSAAPSRSIKGCSAVLPNVIFKDATPGSRTTNNVMNLVSRVPLSPVTSQVSNVVEAESKLHPVTGVSSESTCEPPKRLFSVVWGKVSTRKHKRWEGDGIIEVGAKSVVLKDCEGKEIGRSFGCKAAQLAELEEGSRLTISGKEVEIIDCITNHEPAPVEKTVKSSAPVKKRPRISTPVTQSQYRVPTKHDGEGLVMPQPNSQHQWKNNPEGLPVTDVVLEPWLACRLRPHQKTGIVFLYECLSGLKDVKVQGAVLADEMGLGKTLQAIAMIWLFLKQGPYGGRPLARKVLVVTPSSLVTNWQREFHRWVGREKLRVFAVDQNHKPQEFLQMPGTPIMIISYEMLVRNYEVVSQAAFDVLVCDEAHRLKNVNLKISSFLSSLNCPRRLLLTGTPLQNDLHEFHAIMDFANPGCLGTLQEFRECFEEPILLSRQKTASEEKKAKGESAASELSALTSTFVTRRTREVIGRYLPSRQEVVVFCKPTKIQKDLYRAASDYWHSYYDMKLGTEDEKGPAHLSILTALRKACNHPVLCLRPTSDLQDSVYGCFVDLLKDVAEDDPSWPSLSGKLTVLDTLLRHFCTCSGEKVVLVSYSTKMLDVFERLCNLRRYGFLRLDGNTTASKRQSLVDRFNSKDNQCSVFLLSARAGGVGLNLTGASRLVMYDGDWNPASDLQALSRIWRDGQTRPVYIYRLLSSGTLEEKVFQRQVFKLDLNDAVVDVSDASGSCFSREELKDYFTLRDHEDSCDTHDRLDCRCAGAGEAIIGTRAAEDDSSERECQLRPLGVTKPCTGSASSGASVSSLLDWEHWKPPIDQSLLKELCLFGAEDQITFLLRTCSS